MPKERLSATEVDSLTTTTNDDNGQSPSSLGKATQKSKEQLLEEYGIENKRKAEEITALKGDTEKMNTQIEELQDAIAEMRSRENLTNTQQNALKTMENTVDSLADEIERRQDAQGWVRLNQRTAEKISSEKIAKTLDERDIQQGNWYLEDMSRDMKVPVKELVSNLRPYADKYQDLPRVRRNQLALRDWKEDQEKLSKLSEREKKIEEREIQEKLMREGRGRIPIEKEKSDAWDQAVASGNKRGKISSIVDMIGTQTILTGR